MTIVLSQYSNTSSDSEDSGSGMSTNTESTASSSSSTARRLPQTSRIYIPTTLKNLKLPNKKAHKAKRCLSNKNRKRPIKQGFVPSTRDVVVSTMRDGDKTRVPSHVNTEFMILIQKHISNFITGNAADRHALAGRIVQAVSNNGGRFLKIRPDGQWLAAGWDDAEKYVIESFSRVIADRTNSAKRAAAAKASPKKDLVMPPVQHPKATAPITPAMLMTAIDRYQAEKELLLDMLVRRVSPDVIKQQLQPATQVRQQTLPQPPAKPLKSILRNGHRSPIRPSPKHQRPQHRVVRIQSNKPPAPLHAVAPPPRTVAPLAKPQPPKSALSMLSAVAVAVERAEERHRMRQQVQAA